MTNMGKCASQIFIRPTLDMVLLAISLLTSNIKALIYCLIPIGLDIIMQIRLK